ncbi:MAG: arsenite efflux transporter metallochaperone ArsD [Fermentimonas sp.]|nr:arsenite efflux transporter metallochaperone ArsD [Fermentimonas sp.]
MKKMMIYDPAMCCSTGVCGPSVDKNLLRVATTVSSLTKKGVKIERHNLSDNPQAYIDNREVNKLLNEKGVDVLPITIVDGEVVKTGEYPTNEEFVSLLEIPQEYIYSDKEEKLEIVGLAKNDSSCCSGETGCC